MASAKWRSSWLDWEPAQIIGNTGRKEPAKPAKSPTSSFEPQKSEPAKPTKPPKPSFAGFAGSLPRQSPIIQRPAPAPVRRLDPKEWEENFERWAPERCRFRDGSWTAVYALHDDFCNWSIDHDEVPATRLVFEQLLQSEGFFIERNMVYGLMLASDHLDFYRRR